MKKIIFISFIFIFFLVSCGGKSKTPVDNNVKQKLNVVASLSPIASISKYIGGDKVNISTLIQPGFSPHTFDLKPSDMIKINNADLIISTGLSIDRFLEKKIKNQNTLILKNYVRLIEGDKENHEDNSTEVREINNNIQEDKEIFFDSHIWLSFQNGNQIAKSIKNKLIELDIENIAIYIDNYEKFLVESNTVKNNFLNKINNKSQNNFIVFHDAYTYMFDELNIDQDKILYIQKEDGRELSVSHMKNIIDTIQKNNIKVLFKEPQFENKLINSISEQFGLKILTLDPLGNTIDRNGYFKNMENNLYNLLGIYE